MNKRNSRAILGLLVVLFVLFAAAAEGQGCPAGMLGYWDFDLQADPGRDVFDGNHGQLSGNAQWRPDGVLGGTLHFDDWGKVQVPGQNFGGILGNNPFTLLAWTKADDICPQCGEDYDRILNRGWAHPGGWLLMRSKESFGLYFKPLDGSAWSVARFPNLTGGVSIEAGQWYFVAATSDGAEATIYVNGVQGTTTPISGPVNTLDVDIEISDVQWSPDGVDGFVDEAAILDLVLEQCQVQALYDGILAGLDYCSVTLPSDCSDAPPVARADGPYRSRENQQVTLDGTASYDLDGSPFSTLTLDWDLDGDGTFGDVSGDSPKLTRTIRETFGINQPGLYSLGLEVTDLDDNSDQDSARLYVYEAGVAGDLKVVKWGSTASPGRRSSYYITIVNNGLELVDAVRLEDTLPSLPPGHAAIEYVDGDIPADNPFGPVTGALVWSDLGALDPGQSLQVRLDLLWPNTLVPGTPLSNRVTVSGTQDSTSFDLDNSFVYEHEVVGAFDPNEKGVAPAGFIVPDELLTYTVQFENLGNAAAEDVVVFDTLDSNLDAASLLLGPNGTYDPQSRKISWIFEDIMLPPQGTGFVQFQIKPRDDLSAGAEILNSADIVFDFNAPITTNTVRVVIDDSPPLIEQCAAARLLGTGGDCQAVLPDLRAELLVVEETGETTLLQTPSPGSLAGVGELVAVLRAVDQAGNGAACRVDLAVEDTTPPSASCTDLVLALDGSGGIALMAEAVGGSSWDACGLQSLTVDRNWFTCDDLGPQAVELVVTDVHGNTSSCVATITVADTSPPWVPSLRDIVPPDAPICFPVVDNCGVAEIEISCHKVLPNGGVVDKSDSCVVQVVEGTACILDSGGVGTIITIRAIDIAGGVGTGEITVINPGLNRSP